VPAALCRAYRYLPATFTVLRLPFLFADVDYLRYLVAVHVALPALPRCVGFPVYVTVALPRYVAVAPRYYPFVLHLLPLLPRCVTYTVVHRRSVRVVIRVTALHTTRGSHRCSVTCSAFGSTPGVTADCCCSVTLRSLPTRSAVTYCTARYGYTRGCYVVITVITAFFPVTARVTLRLPYTALTLTFTVLPCSVPRATLPIAVCYPCLPVVRTMLYHRSVTAFFTLRLRGLPLRVTALRDSFAYPTLVCLPRTALRLRGVLLHFCSARLPVDTRFTLRWICYFRSVRSAFTRRVCYRYLLTTCC